MKTETPTKQEQFVSLKIRRSDAVKLRGLIETMNKENDDQGPYLDVRVTRDPVVLLKRSDGELESIFLTVRGAKLYQEEQAHNLRRSVIEVQPTRSFEFRFLLDFLKSINPEDLEVAS